MNRTIKTRLALVIAAVSLSAPLLGAASAQTLATQNLTDDAVYTSASAPTCTTGGSALSGSPLSSGALSSDDGGCVANAGRLQTSHN